MAHYPPKQNKDLGERKTPIEYSTGVFHFKWSPFLSLCFTTIFLFVLIGCEKKVETPDWDTSTSRSQTEDKLGSPEVRPSSPPTLTSISKGDSSASLRFVCYNLRNYLTMRRGSEEKFKPENEVSAIISNIVRANPDILGICEIGTQKDLNHLQTRLKEAGCELPYTYLSLGSDPYRRQALLSRYPISSHKVPKYTYRMRGETHVVRRGILDATVTTPKGDIRLLGAHLKSKRPMATYDQAEVRKEEAMILRKHASTILSESTHKLLVFGDMNDTKGSHTIRLMRGSKDQKLTSIELFDKHGTKWTQYWAKEDIYSRFDYVFASKALLPIIDRQRSYVLDTPPGDPASDHRALVIIIK